MKNQLTLLALGILCLSIVSCTTPTTEEPPAPDLAQIKTDIQAMEDAYAAALNTKTTDAIAAYYADDAVQLPMDMPPVIGKSAILDKVKSEMAQDTTNMTWAFKVQDIWAAGDLVVEGGTSTTTDAAGNTSTGKYISVFEKRDGKYVCIRDIMNNDAAMKNN